MDAEISIEQLLYIGYWVVLLFSLISGLGKSDNITTTLQESKAAKVSSAVYFIPSKLYPSS